MGWLRAVSRLRLERQPGVLVTVTAVRGHAPREAGAKMVVSADAVTGTIGGGNLEETAVARAREWLGSGLGGEPVSLTVSLSDKARTEHGRQCCGGEVSLLLEPLRVVPSVAIFGLGHVGLETARVLARHDLELHLADSRADQLAPQRLACLDDAEAAVHVHHAPLPEVVLGTMPAGTHVLVMTHDHAEDYALCDAALRSGHLAWVGLIGSSAKWSRFRRALALEGHSPEAIARITSPIGLTGDAALPGKEPAVIAVSVAADLLQRIHASAPAGVSAAAAIESGG
jgi:xanthine dehydrogenase accessory factor